MEIRADFTAREVVSTERMAWAPSPLPGVERRMLDRIGDEVARATSLVRYAPGSAFAPHKHGGGEELLVLDGVFCDEHGSYGPGTYIRNPPGSRHQPFSRSGCTLFVKLWQMSPGDCAVVCIDTRAARWEPAGMDGLACVPLFTGPAEQVSLVRMSPGVEVPAHVHQGGEELLVLDGELADEAGRYPRGTWLRNPAGSRHAPFSEHGCTLYVKVGHLLQVSGPRVAAG